MIPKSFILFNTTWNVKQVPKITKDSLMGQCDANTATILLRRNLKKDIKEATYYHELMHSMLDTLGYSDLSADEQFVERMGQALHQVISTAKYE